MNGTFMAKFAMKVPFITLGRAHGGAGEAENTTR
jgi:hypothetical protein